MRNNCYDAGCWTRLVLLRNLQRMSVRNFLPILSWLPSYSRLSLSGDLFAGITVGVMLIPQGMAYAMLAGLPPIYGLYASTIPLLLYAIFGTSRQLSVGPVAMDSLLVAIGVGKLAEYGSEQFISLAILLAMMVGAIQFLLGVFRLGFMVNFLSHPVISGFTSAAAIIIGLNQLPHLLGITAAGSNHLQTLLPSLWEQVAQVHPSTTLIGVGTLVMLLVMRRYLKRVPAALLAVAGGVGIIYFFSPEGVRIVREIPAGFPSFAIPMVNWGHVMALLPTALTIALVGFMEAFSVAKATQAKHKNYQLNANQELIGLGMANFGGSFFRSFPITGGFSRTAVNDQAGAQTQLAAVFSATLIVLTLLFLTPLFYHLPHAVLAAVILVAIVGLIDLKEVLHLWKSNRRDLAMLLITFLATLFLGIQEGIAIGVGLSLIMVLYETSYPHYAVLGRLPGTDTYRNTKRYFEAKEIPHALILRFDAKLFFGNSTIFRSIVDEEIRKRKDLRLVIINAEAINTLDSTAAHMLHDLADDLKKAGIELVFTTVKGPVRDVMAKSKIVDKLGKQHFFDSIQQAVNNFDGEHVDESRQARFQTNYKQT